MFTFVGSYITGDILFMQNCVGYSKKKKNYYFHFYKTSCPYSPCNFFFLSKNANL